MQHSDKQQKQTQNRTRSQFTEAAADKQGAALTPPSYGVNFLDAAIDNHSDSPVQLQSESQTNSDAAADTPLVNRTGLPDKLKAGIESLSGMSMDHVRVHYNSDKPAKLQAHAYAQGSEIHLAAGQEKHLPHEAWHVVQQAQGRVKPTLQMKAGNAGLEAEADLMGAKASRTIKSRDRVGGEMVGPQPVVEAREKLVPSRIPDMPVTQFMLRVLFNRSIARNRQFNLARRFQHFDSANKVNQPTIVYRVDSRERGEIDKQGFIGRGDNFELEAHQVEASGLVSFTCDETIAYRHAMVMFCNDEHLTEVHMYSAVVTEAAPLEGNVKKVLLPAEQEVVAKQVLPKDIKFIKTIKRPTASVLEIFQRGN